MTNLCYSRKTTEQYFLIIKKNIEPVVGGFIFLKNIKNQGCLFESGVEIHAEDISNMKPNFY